VSTQNSTFAEVFLDVVRQAVREEIQALGNGRKESGLLTPDELADKLKIPVSWVYEQSRQNNIPLHRGPECNLDIVRTLYVYALNLHPECPQPYALCRHRLIGYRHPGSQAGLDHADSLTAVP
jgi:hypothetical protein